MVSLAEDLMLALDRVAFAKRLGVKPDPWQEDLLRSASERVLLNCCRQSGKSTMRRSTPEKPRMVFSVPGSASMRERFFISMPSLR